jgi:hypothetical protein
MKILTNKQYQDLLNKIDKKDLSYSKLSELYVETEKKLTEAKDFKEFKETTIGKPKEGVFEPYRLYYCGANTQKDKTLFERIEAIEDKFTKLEKYLGIQYTEEKVEGYKKIKKSK